MTRKSLFTAAGAALLLASQARAVPPSNGVVTGLSVVWNAANKIHVEVGEGYANSNPYGGNVTFFWNANLQHGQVVTPNTAYYVYACYDASAMPAGFTNPPVVSDIAPSNGGIGAGINAGNGDACNALFLGSIVTDSTGNLVPFTRTGEEVTLALVNRNNNCTSGGWFSGAGAVNVNLPSFTNTNCWLVTFNSTAGVGNTCNGTDNKGNLLFLPYPASASAMLIDWTLANADTSPSHHIDVLPQSPNPAAPNYPDNTQLDLFLPAAVTVGMSTVPFARYFSHTRVNPTVVAATNVGNNPPAPATSQEFNVCIDQFTPSVTSITGYAIYRGYVESIGHLTQGDGT